MQGVTLGELEATSMMDVIHYLFEEDSTPVFDQHMEARSRLRTGIFREMYDAEYPFDVATPGTANAGPEGAGPGAGDFNFEESTVPPEKMKVKTYIPPTDPEDLPALLGGPMGG